MSEIITVLVYVNGIAATVGDGAANRDCYFSNDGGGHAASKELVNTTSTFHWLVDNAGYDIAPSDNIVAVIRGYTKIIQEGF